MKRMFSLAATILVAAFISGCSSVEPAKHMGNTPLASLKSAYVVLAPGANTTIAEFIQVGLAHHDLKVSIGALRNKPKDVAFYVNYQDDWKWDVTMYLNSLDVQFVDNSNDQVIASGSFKQGLFHNFPDPRTTTFEVIDSIFNTK